MPLTLGDGRSGSAVDDVSARVSPHGPACGLPSSGELVVGISGTRRNAAAAVCVGGTLASFCEQERASRVKAAKLEPGSLPSEAVAVALQASGHRSLADVRTFVVAEESAELLDVPVVRVDHHRAHAAAAFRTSPFAAAAILVCDQHSRPPLSVWVGDGPTLRPHTWNGAAGVFASVYSECADVFGFGPGQEHRLEALARLDTGSQSARLQAVIGYREGGLWASPDWRRVVADWLADGSGRDVVTHRAQVAGAFQFALERALLELLIDLRASTGMSRLCLTGGLFYNTHFNTRISQSGIFDDVFVAPSPGNPGLAAGAALDIGRSSHQRVEPPISPFLGPEFDLEHIKRTLDNCKMSYECLSDGDVIVATVEALQRGHLVGWFQGRMEWGPRALGNRSILASPLSPYVLDNLNLYLKQRERHRTYGLSVREADAASYFVGPARSRFMEFEYEVRDRERFQHVLPRGAVRLRVQTVDELEEASRRYGRLHQAFGDAAGTPVLVNTSFNGFSEPIVCSPRDALRVFFGTGLDMLVLDRFVLRK